MDIEQFASILAARKKLMISIVCAFVLISTLASFLWPKSYVSEVSVVVDAKGTDPVTGGNLAGDLLPDFAATQIDIINSHNVGKKVVHSLNLQNDETWLSKFSDADIEYGTIEDWIADKILDNVKVIPSRDSKVMVIAYTAKDPNVAAEFANTFAEAYIQTALEIKLDPARRQSTWFNQQLNDLRDKLEKAKKNLSDFQLENNLISRDEHLDVEKAHLEELSSQYANLQAANHDAQSRVHQLNQAMAKNRVEELADVLGNTLLQNMKAELVRAQGKLANIATRYDRNHPEYLSAAAEVSTLKTKLSREIETVKGSILEAARLAAQREQEMRGATEAQKHKILAMNALKDTQYVLDREAVNAQNTYDAAVQRASQLGLESRLDQSNIAILNPAFPPNKAKWPKPLLNIVLAALLGSILGLFTIIALETRDRRIRCSKDIETTQGIPVLAIFEPVSV